MGLFSIFGFGEKETELNVHVHTAKNDPDSKEYNNEGIAITNPSEDTKTRDIHDMISGTDVYPGDNNNVTQTKEGHRHVFVRDYQGQDTVTLNGGEWNSAKFSDGTDHADYEYYRGGEFKVIREGDNPLKSASSKGDCYIVLNNNGNELTALDGQIIIGENSTSNTELYTNNIMLPRSESDYKTTSTFGGGHTYSTTTITSGEGENKKEFIVKNLFDRDLVITYADDLAAEINKDVNIPDAEVYHKKVAIAEAAGYTNLSEALENAKTRNGLAEEIAKTKRVGDYSWPFEADGNDHAIAINEENSSIHFANKGDNSAIITGSTDIRVKGGDGNETIVIGGNSTEVDADLGKGNDNVIIQHGSDGQTVKVDGSSAAVMVDSNSNTVKANAGSILVGVNSTSNTELFTNNIMLPGSESDYEITSSFGYGTYSTTTITSGEGEDKKEFVVKNLDATSLEIYYADDIAKEITTGEHNQDIKSNNNLSQIISMAKNAGYTSLVDAIENAKSSIEVAELADEVKGELEKAGV